MGGKSKQSQRTKNNVRPSSSGRSAELLSNSVGSLSSLTASPTGKPLPVLFPSLIGTTLDQNLDADFTLCIKKLNKKDPITKTKALQELIELVNTKKSEHSEDVVAILPQWTRVYRSLSTDPDHKVREATQLAHGVIVPVVGRQLGPVLRSLLPAWLQAQYDTSAPAAAAAQHSLTSTFPENKLPEVISFCKSEVMAHLLDILIGSTEASLQNKGDTPESIDAQLERLTTASLQGLQYFTQKLPDAHSEWLWTELTPLLNSDTYWKLAQNKSATVKAAWYTALSSLITRYARTLLAAHGARACRVLLAGARERSAHVAQQLWTCLLLIMHTVENWHEWVDKKNELCKRILELLENGGWGDARLLSTMILPLLAHLPSDLLTQEYYEQFFKAMFTGLNKKAIINSKSERQFWITSLAECMRYLSIQNLDFVVEVTTSVHRTWLERILSTGDDAQLRTNLIKHSATNMVALVKYWLKQSTEDNPEKYDQLIRNYWQNIASTILGQVDKLSTDTVQMNSLIDGHIMLLQSLKTSLVEKKKKSIKFDGDAETKSEDMNVVATELCDASSLERYTHNLNNIVEKVCARYLEFFEKHKISGHNLIPLMTLIKEFESKELLVSLSGHFSPNTGKDLTVYALYENLLQRWMSGDTMRCTEVVDLVFLTMRYLTEDEQDRVFRSFDMMLPTTMTLCLTRALSHPWCLWASSMRFARGAGASAALASVARRAAQGGEGGLLLLAVQARREGERMISDTAIDTILLTFSEALSDLQSVHLDTIASLAAQILSNLAADGYTEYDGLMTVLFKVNLGVPRGDARLSTETWSEVQSSWQDGLAALPTDAQQSFLEKAVALAHDSLFDDKTSLNAKNIVHLATLCPTLLINIDEEYPKHNAHEIESLVKQLFDFKVQNEPPIEKYALRYDCIRSTLQCPIDDDNAIISSVVQESSTDNIKELSKDNLISHCYKVLFRAEILKALLVIEKATEISDNEQLPEEKGTDGYWCNDLLENEYIAKEFLNVQYEHAVINSLFQGYAFWEHHQIIATTKTRLDSLLYEVEAVTSKDKQAAVLAGLSDLAATIGYYWAYAAKQYAEICLSQQEQTSLAQAAAKKMQTAYHVLQASYQVNTPASLKTAHVLMLRSFYLAHSDRVSEQLMSGALQDDCNIDVIVNKYYQHNDVMLYERDITTAPWRQVLSNAAILDCLSELVDARGWDAPSHHWDFITITLSSVLSSIEKSKANWGSTKVAMLARSAFKLFRSVAIFVSHINETSLKKQPSDHVAHLPTEWKDIFAPDINKNLFNILVHVLDAASTTPLTLPRAQFLSPLLSSFPLLDWSALPVAQQLGAYSPRAVITRCGDVLAQPVDDAWKFMAYAALRVIERAAVLDDAEKLAVWSNANVPDDGEEYEERPKPEFAISYYDAARGRVEESIVAALDEFESCEDVPFTNSHRLTLGYLLLIDAMCNMSFLARGDLVHQYIVHFREQNFCEILIPLSLRILRSNVHLEWESPPKPEIAEMFASTPALSIDTPPSPRVPTVLACRCLQLSLAGCPAPAARAWWGGAATRPARALASLARNYISPGLVKQQLARAAREKKYTDDPEDIEITVHWSSNELVCVYRVEEDRRVTLTVGLGREFPLSLPQVTTSAGPAHYTKWISMFLGYQNGSVTDAIKMWVSAMQRRISVTPVCYICYMRLSLGGELPRRICRQCNNRYHTKCIFKWFATSHKSTCPLCRGAF